MVISAATTETLVLPWIGEMIDFVRVKVYPSFSKKNKIVVTLERWKLMKLSILLMLFWEKNNRTWNETLILEPQKYSVAKQTFWKHRREKIIVQCWASKLKVRISMRLWIDTPYLKFKKNPSYLCVEQTFPFRFRKYVIWWLSFRQSSLVSSLLTSATSTVC